MKTLTLVAIASLLLVAGCATSPQESGNAQDQQASSGSSMHQYQCDSGASIAAAYPDTDSATVEYQGKRYDMQIAASASGARYVGGGLEWWTKGAGSGAEGMLLQHEAEGSSGKLIERCTVR
ncbi:MliC family protein [uncultured Halomonas sp.]|uniref:MliC family protein n=1 Tax=uncultured Halomonas sp. TaxID=173971 RepID=UPI00261146B8|nr:MliC family protein [uncultured Halomonas sp.]